MVAHDRLADVVHEGALVLHAGVQRYLQTNVRKRSRAFALRDILLEEARSRNERIAVNSPVFWRDIRQKLADGEYEDRITELVAAFAAFARCNKANTAHRFR